VKVLLERTFPMPAPVEATWAMLADIEAVASCMPGAKITERIDDRHFKGTVSVKVGPATLSFRGDIEVKELDPANHSVQLIAKGTDSTGSSAASMDMKARAEATADGASALIGASEASVSGKAAAFAGRMMDSVADQILRQFAANFATQLAARNPAPVSTTAAAPVSAAVSGTASGAAVAPAAASSELNGLALVWAALKSWLHGLFSKQAR
jgi:carbon monoxide dehydrogenase subunit G